MEDSEITALLLRRDESAIEAIEETYGARLKNLALNLLGSRQDAEECVNDALAAAWETPPQGELLPWLLRIVRNKAVSLYRKNHSARRALGLETLLSELGDCLPSADDPAAAAEGKALSAEIDRFLKALPEADRRLFVRRYFLGEALAVIADSEHVKPKKLVDRLYLIRKKLRTYLKKEGFLI